MKSNPELTREALVALHGLVEDRGFVEGRRHPDSDPRLEYETRSLLEEFDKSAEAALEVTSRILEGECAGRIYRLVQEHIDHYEGETRYQSEDHERLFGPKKSLGKSTLPQALKFEWAPDPLPPEFFPDIPTAKLARWLGVTRSYMYKIRSGERPCSGTMRMAILCLLSNPELFDKIPRRSDTEWEVARVQRPYLQLAPRVLK